MYFPFTLCDDLLCKGLHLIGHDKLVIRFHHINIEQGCESSDFKLISDFFALHKTPFSDF